MYPFFFKVDAHGSDLDVVISAGNYIQNVGRIILGVQDLSAGDALLMYANQPSKEFIISRAEERGFSFWKT